tara:strand:- start:78 stop:662 length:585 start_codon:yes stop_codon:yes gene_type:complete
MRGLRVEGIMAGKSSSGFLSNTPVPDVDPHLPEGSIEASIQALSGVLDAVFRPWVVDRISLQWLEVTDDRLGMTRFEEGSNELIRRRKLRLDPGPVTIGLHPALLEDEMLYRHTFVHELLHAAGLTIHSKEHDRLVSEIAPAPSLKESPLLRRMRDAVLGNQTVQSWSCGHCGFEWKRRTVRKPRRCVKCARPL